MVCLNESMRSILTTYWPYFSCLFLTMKMVKSIDIDNNTLHHKINRLSDKLSRKGGRLSWKYISPDEVTWWCHFLFSFISFFLFSFSFSFAPHSQSVIRFFVGYFTVFCSVESWLTSEVSKICQPSRISLTSHRSLCCVSESSQMGRVRPTCPAIAILTCLLLWV